MWHETTKYKKKTENYNEVFRQIKGELEDKEAKITFFNSTSSPPPVRSMIQRGPGLSNPITGV